MATVGDGEIFGANLQKLTRVQMMAISKLDPRNRIMFAWPMPEDVSTSAVRLLNSTGLLRKVSRLSLRCGDECVQIVTWSRHAVGIRELSVHGCAGDEYLPHVDTTGCYYASTRTAELISRSKHLPTLRTLRVAALGKAARVLLSGRLKLSVLDLTTDDSGVRAVAGSTSVRSLTVLRLFGGGFWTSDSHGSHGRWRL